MIYLELFYYFWPPFPHFVENEEDESKLNPIFEPFRKIERLNLHGVGIEDAVKHLTDAKNLKLFIKNVSLYPNSSEELENLTNPKLLKNGVRIIELKF